MKFQKWALVLTLLTPHFASAAVNELDARWENYVVSLSTLHLQEGCKPVKIPADRGVPHRGVVMAIHGFTACPQQFFKWATQLTAEGYDVLLPLLPGHGRVPLRADVPGGKYSDDSADVPGLYQWQEYESFTDQMNSIMTAAEGQHVIVGLSVGGTVGLSAIQKEPDLYDRALIFVPLLDYSNAEYRYASKLAILPIAGKYRVTWGDECHTERTLGRAGICDFDATAAAAAEIFGFETLQSIKPGSTPIQMVGVEGDPTASDVKIEAAHQKLVATSDQEFDHPLCFVRKGANHSLISTYDTLPPATMWWLSSLLERSTAYVTQGTSFPAKVPSIEGTGNLQCDL